MMRRRLLPFLPTPLTIALVLYAISHLLEQTLAVLPWKFDLRWSVIRLTALVLAAPVYGFYRVLAFHPRFRPAYRQFLARSPWKWGDPLPLGPIQLNWRDLIFLAGLAGMIVAEQWLSTPASMRMSPDVPLIWLIPVSAMILFTAAYFLTLWLAIREDRITFLAAVFILPLAVYPCFDAWVAVAVVVLIYLILLVGLRRTLGRFPWNLPDWTTEPQQRYLDEAMRFGVIGWPFRSLGPYAKVPGVSWPMAIVLAALPAWWFHGILGMIIHSDEVSSMNLGDHSTLGWPYIARMMQGAGPVGNKAPTTFLYFCCIFAAVRVVRYFWGYLPPISLMGRLFTGNLIIPGYDQIFVAPILVVLFGTHGPRLLGYLPIPALLFPATCVFIPLWMIMAIGPTLRRWRLVGTHRIINVSPTSTRRKQQNNQWQNIEIHLFGR